MKVTTSGDSNTNKRTVPYLARGESTKHLYLVTEHHVICLQEGASDFGKVFASCRDKSPYVSTDELVTLHN